jgi:hypothetical protein
MEDEIRLLLMGMVLIMNAVVDQMDDETATNAWDWLAKVNDYIDADEEARHDPP